MTPHFLRVQPCLGAVKICLHMYSWFLRRSLAHVLCHEVLNNVDLETVVKNPQKCQGTGKAVLYFKGLR